MAPPATAMEDGEYPALRIASKTTSVPMQTASMSARKMCPRPNDHRNVPFRERCHSPYDVGDKRQAEHSRHNHFH